MSVSYDPDSTLSGLWSSCTIRHFCFGTQLWWPSLGMPKALFITFIILIPPTLPPVLAAWSDKESWVHPWSCADLSTPLPAEDGHHTAVPRLVQRWGLVPPANLLSHCLGTHFQDGTGDTDETGEGLKHYHAENWWVRGQGRFLVHQGWKYALAIHSRALGGVDSEANTGCWIYLDCGFG